MKTKSIVVTCNYVSPNGDRCNYGSVGFRIKWRPCPRCHGNGSYAKVICARKCNPNKKKKSN